VPSRAEFENEVKIFARSGCDILHISAHGNADGIGFTNGDTLSWSELYTLLLPSIHDKYLLLSSCSSFGSNQLIRLFEASDRRPFVVFGTPENVLWPQAFLAWVLVYHALNADEEPAEALRRALAAAYLATGRSFHACVFIDERHTDDGKPTRFSWTGEQMLDRIVKTMAAPTLEIKPAPSGLAAPAAAQEASNLGTQEK
jgi:hypothetical protein